MKIEPKLKNSPSIYISKNEQVISFDHNTQKRESLAGGVRINSEDVFGFTVIFDKGNKNESKVYATQMPIVLVEINSGSLKVYETCKLTPWKISLTSGMLECKAKFSLRNEELLRDKFDLPEVADMGKEIEELNEQSN